MVKIKLWFEKQRGEEESGGNEPIQCRRDSHGDKDGFLAYVLLYFFCGCLSSKEALAIL